MQGKELQEQMVANMKRWQRIEDQSVASTGQILEKTKNPVLRLVMEIIQSDSQTHRRVQQLVIDSLEKEAASLTPDELADVWTLIENHVQLEKRTIEVAEETLAALKGRHMLVQQYLLQYLLMDEQKHTDMLERLDSIKAGMYPYA